MGCGSVRVAALSVLPSPDISSQVGIKREALEESEATPWAAESEDELQEEGEEEEPKANDDLVEDRASAGKDKGKASSSGLICVFCNVSADKDGLAGCCSLWTLKVGGCFGK